MNGPAAPLSDGNARLAAARRLTSRSARRETGLLLAEGGQSVAEALKFPNLITEVFATEAALNRNSALLDAARTVGLRVDQVSSKAAAGLSETVTPQGLIAVCRLVDVDLASALRAGTRLVAVVLEPNDPGNLGTIIRTADAAGADAVVVIGGGVDPYNGKAVRASAGSLFHVPIVVGPPWREVQLELGRHGIQSLATSGAADADLDTLIDDGVLAQPTAWLFGNEAHGLPADVVEAATRAVRIPIRGSAESLNLSVAAGICLYASARAQRLRK